MKSLIKHPLLVQTLRIPAAFFAVAVLVISSSAVQAQAVTARQLIEAQLAAAGVAVDATGATAATTDQFKAAVLAAIEANPNRTDEILIEALKMIRDRFVASYLDNQGRYSREALVDLFKSAIEKYGPQNRPSEEARQRLEEMLRAAYEIFPELTGDFLEAIDTFLSEEQRSALDDLVSKLVGSGQTGGSAGYFSMSNPGNVGGTSFDTKSSDKDQDKPKSTKTGGGGGDTGTTPATPVVP